MLTKGEIIADLGENYNSSDEAVLETILNEVTADALSISNRSNTEVNKILLKSEIKKCVKTIYLQRGSEDVKSLSTSGLSSSYVDAYNELRDNIIKNGKRKVK